MLTEQQVKHFHIYNPHWVENQMGSEKRQRWIDRLRELGFLDTV